jgi:hypothetical protein
MVCNIPVSFFVAGFAFRVHRVGRISLRISMGDAGGRRRPLEQYTRSAVRSCADRYAWLHKEKAVVPRKISLRSVYMSMKAAFFDKHPDMTRLLEVENRCVP